MLAEVAARVYPAAFASEVAIGVLNRKETLTVAVLQRAIEIAVEAHRDQVDKAGAPYVLHPLRLMLRVSGNDAMIAAVLHDVVEDTDWTIDRLRREGFSETVLAAIDCLTRRDGETYEEFIERAAVNPVARRVKLADLEDNMDIRRIRMLGPNAHDRLARYHAAWYRLSEDAPA